MSDGSSEGDEEGQVVENEVENSVENKMESSATEGKVDMDSKMQGGSLQQQESSSDTEGAVESLKTNCAT